MDAFIHQKLAMLAVMAIIALIDMIGGVLIAIKNKQFQLEKLPEFVKTFAVYAWSWAAVELVAYLPVYFNVEITGLSALLANYGGSTVYAFIVLKYVASILAHMQDSDALPLKAERALGAVGVNKSEQG